MPLSDGKNLILSSAHGRQKVLFIADDEAEGLSEHGGLLWRVFRDEYRFEGSFEKKRSIWGGFLNFVKDGVVLSSNAILSFDIYPLRDVMIIVLHTDRLLRFQIPTDFMLSVKNICMKNRNCKGFVKRKMR